MKTLKMLSTVVILYVTREIFGQIANMAQEYSTRFEYKHSLRKPHIASKDGSIFLWTVSGDAIGHSDQLRLAPSLTSKSGSAWNQKPMVESESWVVEMSFRIYGRGKLGADGMAMWYTASPGSQGPVFGSNDGWVGLGIFFDSFDNDYVAGSAKDTPLVAMMLNDGTRTYDHHNDGGTNLAAKCQKDFRNRPHPVKVRIEYLRNSLTVYLTNGNTPRDAYELCLKTDNIFLPKNGYFGLSAATGGLADDHDVLSFEVSSYNPVSVHAPLVMPVDEKQRLDEEYKHWEQEFQAEKQKFKQEHPDQFKAPEAEIIEQYEDPQFRQIHIIQEMQESLFRLLQEVDSKLGRLSQTQQIILQSRGADPAAAPGSPAIDGGFHIQEATEILQASRELVGVVLDIKKIIVDLQNDQRLRSSGSMNQYESEQQKIVINELKMKLDQMIGLQHITITACNEPSCLSSSIFIITIVIQSVLLIFFAILKRKNEKPKFY